MELFFQISGGIFIAVILLILAIYLFFKIKFGKYLSLDPEQNQTPFIIHLNEDFSPAWINGKKVKAVEKELVQLGFERGKSYSIPEMQNLELTAYFKVPLVAVLYRHENAGIWVDLAFEKPGELELTVTNVLMGVATDLRPEKKIDYLKGKSVSELYEHINLYIENGASYTEPNPDNFRQLFEETY